MRTGKLTLVFVMAAAAALGCGGDGKSSADGGAGRGGSGTGGTTGTGTTGGAGGSTGGTTATGGTAGTTATGGTAGTSATGGTAGTTATGGAGGTSATGGMGGTTATGGTGGASAMCEVPCLTNLISNCTPMGTCMSQTSFMPSFSSNQCYSNGVKVSGVFSGTPGGSGTYQATYSKMGQTCYSIEAPFMANQQTFTFTYKNAGGTVVATGTYDTAMNKFTVMCTGGMTYDLSSPACANVPRGMSGMMGGNDCPMGTCQ